ncbi:uncharacterized protein LOC123556719 isoform X2 [Mercenaria mercenaria]|uniref:uncharacterized protein LOC123556719 isoform X2 n=1 Tax=Mercenaria mercenaria TaxID=6596 RepID=UPI00234EBA13|nr:uncharacterized protein LOC123556719 isoform X2 [Mercenaria mercenaria]
MDETSAENFTTTNSRETEGRIHRKRSRNSLLMEEDGKWRPFWQRGHTTLDEMKEQKREKNMRYPKFSMRKNVPRKNRLYHSNLDLRSVGRTAKKVKISKSVSMHGLNRMPPIDSGKREIRNNQSKLSRTNSQLNLPVLEPDIELNGAVGSRDNSAGTSVRSSVRYGRTSVMRANEEEVEESEDEDVYLSDDDPEVSRRNLDKAGDYIVEHDWILKGELEKEARKVKTLHNKVQIVLPDEDPLESIQSRMDEINMMVKPRAEFGNYLETIDPEQKEKIVKYKYVHHSEIRKKKRKNWTAINRFQDAVLNIILLYRACQPRRRYLHEDKPDTAPDGVKKIKQKNKLDRDNLKKSSLGFEMQLSLATQPEYRTSEDIKRITQVLRATKAFKHLFPAQLEEQLARVVAYERYDSRRIVAQQGRDPERFYYVLTGKMNKVREYRLLSGVVTRDEGYVEKGTTTDPQEMSQNWPREHHLVAKGHVEVLILDRNDFADLLHTSKGPPIDFLQMLDLFKEFPCEEFETNPEAIDFRYYGQEKIVVKDSNRTPWLHVVKTGHVKVVRTQSVIDVNNEDKFTGQSTEELGCVRPFSHAGAMLGLLAKQRKMKTMVGAISFPELTRMYRHSIVNIPNNSNNSFQENSPRPAVKKKHRANSSPCAERKEPTELHNAGSRSGRLANIAEDSESSVSGEKKSSTPTLVITSPTLKSASPNQLQTNGKPDSPKQKQSLSFLPPINNERKNSEFVPHGTYLTREMTEFDPVYKKKQKKEVVQRDTYLQLDVLKPGDIFVGKGFLSNEGFEHIEPQALASEAPGVTLISDGAEIIKISKRFFLQHAKNNTMLKVETMQREYMTPEEAKTVMYNKETWKQYKSVLLQRTVDTLHRKHVEKVP